jgi:drug/metabolite transporter (DMT)-like permease
VWLVICGALLQGVGNAIIGVLVAEDSVFWFIGLAFALASICGLALRRIGRRGLGKKMGFAAFLSLNATTAVTFVSFYLALVFVPASLAAGVEAAAAPLAALGYGAIRRSRARAAQWSLAVCMFIASVGFGWSQSPRFAAQVSAPLWCGLGLAVLAGVGMAAIAVLSSKLAREGFTARDLMAARYHLIWAIALAVALARSGGNLGPAWRSAAWAAPLGLVAVVVPLFAIQAGMMRIRPSVTVGLMASVPAVSYFVEVVGFGGGSAFSWGLLSVSVALICVYGLLDKTLTPGRPAMVSLRRRMSGPPNKA